MLKVVYTPEFELPGIGGLNSAQQPWRITKIPRAPDVPHVRATDAQYYHIVTDHTRGHFHSTPMSWTISSARFPDIGGRPRGVGPGTVSLRLNAIAWFVCGLHHAGRWADYLSTGFNQTPEYGFLTAGLLLR
ncbi:hypothetical protein LSH36_174g09020 [Paralvinella palmiformis]|uniref:Uncharacterized protein n=1 Tax=Paralvinella palmiformis TaxID=53620 RepID=A0AAD9JU49_9ANNE|nr:hypothetical protein LSH36_174g09020 [Paralvinella palmiformis]